MYILDPIKSYDSSSSRQLITYSTIIIKKYPLYLYVQNQCETIMELIIHFYSDQQHFNSIRCDRIKNSISTVK